MAETSSTVVPRRAAMATVLEWLRTLDCGVIADIGGSTGIKFHAFAPLLDLSPSCRWVVVDVPKVADLGRRLATEQGI